MSATSGERARRFPDRARAAAAMHQDLLISSAKSAVAGMLAWMVTSWGLHSGTAVFGPYAALLTVSGTVIRSYTDGARRLLATVAGVLLAYVAGLTLGFTVAGLGTMLFVASVVGGSRRLGASALGVPTTALFVLVYAQGTHTWYIRDLLVDTAIGAVIGVVINVVLLPPIHVRRAGLAVQDYSRRICEVAVAIAEGLVDDWGENTEAWLQRTRDLDECGEATRHMVGRASESLRFNPRSRVEGWHATPLRAYLVALTALERAAGDLRNVARALRDGAGNEIWPYPPEETFLRRYSGLLCRIARVIDLFGNTDPDSEELTAALERARRSHGALAEWTRRHDLRPDAWTVYGSLLGDAEAILHDLSTDAGNARIPRTEELHLHLRPRRS